MITPTEAGLEQPDFPSELEVTVRFDDVGEGKTKLTIEYPKPETEKQFQAMLKSGMKEGWSSSLEKLEASLRPSA